MTYQVKIDIFEGPLDLLLHLTKKHEVDITDIPIASITEQYLEYIEMMKSMNLDMAGEFLLMAATLIHIKSKMLLPTPTIGDIDEDDDGIDPRAELMRKLLEYQRFKEAAESLYARNILGRDVFGRGTPFDLGELKEMAEAEDEAEAFTDVSLFDLMEAFKVILRKVPAIHKVDITVDRFKVADKINSIMDMLGEGESRSFEELFEGDALKGEVIVTFLAILELAKLLMIRLHQSFKEGDRGKAGRIRVYRAEGTAGEGGDIKPSSEFDGTDNHDDDNDDNDGEDSNDEPSETVH
jgi:segregation and condensation protein A